MAESLPVLNITIIEGADYSLSLTLAEDGVPTDLTGYTFQAEIRENYAATAPILVSFTSAIPDPTTGEVILSLDAATTQDLFSASDANRARSQVGYWDAFYQSPSGVRSYLVGGRVYFIQTITARVEV